MALCLVVARKDRFIFWTQADYFGLDSDESGNLPSGTRLESDTFLPEAAFGYQFNGPFEGSTIDAMLGGAVRVFRKQADH